MKSLKGFIKTFVVIILALILLGSVSVSTYPDEYKLIKQFGAIVKIVDTPGWTFKVPFIQTTTSIPKYKMCYDIAPSYVNTSDKKIMIVDSFAIWQVKDPKKYVTTLGANQATAEGRIDTVVFNSMKTVLSSTTQEDIISGRDGRLAQEITDKIGNSLDAYGIELVKVETKMLDLPDENKSSVYQRMISERNNIAAGYTAQGDSESKKIMNETDKEVSIKRYQLRGQKQRLRQSRLRLRVKQNIWRF